MTKSKVDKRVVKKKEKVFQQTNMFVTKIKDPNYPNKRIVELQFKNQQASIEEVRAVAQKFSNRLAGVDKNSFMSVSLMFGNGNSGEWRGAKKTDVGYPVSVWSTEDSDAVDPGEVTGFSLTFAIDEKYLTNL